MTLTSILPTLRASIPDPIVADRWPTATRARVDDVVVAGVSLSRLALLCGTPCVHVAPAPGEPRDAPGGAASVVVTAVTTLRDGGEGLLALDLDADIDPALARWSEVRLIGRVSVARPVRASVGDHVLRIPADVRKGDLLVVPCRGQLSLRDLRRAPSAPTSRDREGRS